jgi:hypothetical protein
MIIVVTVTYVDSQQNYPTQQVPRDILDSLQVQSNVVEVNSEEASSSADDHGTLEKLDHRNAIQEESTGVWRIASIRKFQCIKED